MNANIFLKENGLKKCSRIVEDLIEQGNESEFVKDLKHLVESHELVERTGGLSLARQLSNNFVHVTIGLDVVQSRTIQEAIIDVDSCQ